MGSTIKTEDGGELWHKRHRGHETYDRVEIETVPRYKTSGLSGDQWRTSARLRLYFKGKVVAEEHYRDVESALKFVWQLMDANATPVSNEWIAHEEKKCDQPGCSEDFVARFALKEEFSSEGHRIDPKDIHLATYRKFCRKHLRRGDCGREDSDDNYTPIDGVTADESTNIEQSPSVVAEPIHVDWDALKL